MLHIQMGTKVSDMDTQTSLTQAVSEVLTAEKAVSGITYDALVEKTGISRSQLIRYFKGQRSMTLTELELISGILGLKFFDVIDLAQARARAKK